MENSTHLYLKSQSSNNLPPVKLERTGWRDEWISNQHRKFGWNAPMVDIDFLGLEYDSGQPVAIIEYKHYNARVNLNHPSIQAQSILATNSKIPFFVVVYYPETSHYYLYPINQIAQQIKYCDQPRPVSERNFVKLLYHLRKRSAPEDILNNLEKTIPDQFPAPNVN